MTKQVYLVQGANLPTKVVVASFDLEPEAVLEVQNRFKTSGPLYASLKPVHGGFIRLNGPELGPEDTALLLGFDLVRLESDGGTKNLPSKGEPGLVIPVEETVISGRRAFLVTYTTEAVKERWVVVVDDERGWTSSLVVKALAELCGKVTIECQYLGTSAFVTDPAFVPVGFTLKTAPALEMQTA